MKILVQNVLSLKFLTADGEWTRDFKEANNFGDAAEAIALIRRRRLDRVRVLVDGSGELVECGSC